MYSRLLPARNLACHKIKRNRLIVFLANKRYRLLIWIAFQYNLSLDCLLKLKSMSKKLDQVTYLNPANGLKKLQGSLLPAIEALPARLVRAPADQWIATFRSFGSKGVKQAEIDDCEVVPWLQSTSGPIERTAVAEFVKSRQVTIKEVVLGAPKYKAYSFAKYAEGTKYQYSELLYVANSQAANLDDRIEEIDWQLEEYNFDIEMLSSNPEGLFLLENERARLMKERPKAHDFTQHHFSSSVDGKHGKNLIAHGRELVCDGLYFINEIQSDWAQKGRKSDWNGVPRGPLVTDTKLWAGMVARRMIQRAASNPSIKQVAWIRGYMRNGWHLTESEGGSSDGLDEFYLKTLPGIVDKVIGKAGGKCRLGSVTIGQTVVKDVPMFDMTDSVREKLKESQPMYSLAGLNPVPRDISDVPDVDIERLQKKAKAMLGSAHSLRFAKDLFDIASGKKVAGRQVNRMVSISVNAKDMDFVLDHEAFHYAEEHLLSYRERSSVVAEFMPGTALNNRVRDLLIRQNDKAAAEQCSNPREAAAHGFALWSRGDLALKEDGPRTLFESISIALQDGMAWLRKIVKDDECVTAEDVFTSLKDGYLARREEYKKSSAELIPPERQRF